MKTLYILLVALLFAGCNMFGSKDNTLFNLTPDEWFAQILFDIRDKDLEAADEHYTSFAAEHINSDYLPQLMLIMAQANADEEKYVMANFYLDEYIKRFGSFAGIEFAKFLKLKSNFDSFAKPNRNQKLLIDSIASAQNFLSEYPNSQYRPLVETILAKLSIAQVYLNEEIQSLYERKGRKDSAQIYKERLDESGIGTDEIIRPTLPWYMRPFE